MTDLLNPSVPLPNNRSAEVSRFPVLHDPRYPVHSVAERLEPYLRVIVDKLHPQQIILFGSYAYGIPTEHSDFDLLVIRKGIQNTKESNLEIRRTIWDVEPVASFTILSQTPEGLEEKLRSGSFIYREIKEKGLEVYAA